MQNKNDRGMIKWQPFIALKEQEEQLKILLANRQKSQMPLLSEDDYYALNIILFEAYETEQELIFTVFKNGKFIDYKGSIKKIDELTKTITLNSLTKLKCSEIINIINS